MWKQYFQFSQSYNTLKEQSHMTLKGEGHLKVTFKRQKNYSVSQWERTRVPGISSRTNYPFINVTRARDQREEDTAFSVPKRIKKLKVQIKRQQKHQQLRKWGRGF